MTLNRCFKKVKNKTSTTIVHFPFFQSLPIFSQRNIYDNVLKYFLDNNLISQKHSGFRPGDFCINQVLSITQDIFNSFNNGLEVRGVFLDISKDFDKVWHDGLIFNLKQNRIKYKLLCLLIDFLKNVRQIIVS